MGTAAGNMKAQKNGRAIETKLLGKQVSSHHVLDTPTLELKTAQHKCKSKSKPHGASGRFVLYHHQHRLLLRNKGSYMFVVIDDDGNILKQKKISARQVEKHFKVLGRQQVTLSHPTVFKVGAKA